MGQRQLTLFGNSDNPMAGVTVQLVWRLGDQQVTINGTFPAWKVQRFVSDVNSGNLDENAFSKAIVLSFKVAGKDGQRICVDTNFSMDPFIIKFFLENPNEFTAQ